MRPTVFVDIESSESTRRPAQFGILTIDQTDPRLRNRIHNQAQKFKARIGKRRVVFPSASAAKYEWHSTRFPKGHVSPAKALSDQPSEREQMVAARKQMHARHYDLEEFIKQQFYASRPYHTVTSGGMRGDPFNSYPIPAKGVVRPAVDYFLHDYAPIHISPKNEDVQPGEGSLPLARRYFSLALENEFMFEIMVALAEAARAIRRGHHREPTPDVLLHYGKALKVLREKMEAESQAPSDAVLFTVLAFMGIAYMYSDFEALETHLIAIRQMVAMRGGVDNLGWQGFTKASVIGLEAVWAFHANKQMMVAPQKANIRLTYPTHPFSPGLCATIAKLPQGFADMALTGALSLQVIDRLRYIGRWVKQVQDGPKPRELLIGEPGGTHMKETMRCVELLGLPHLRLEDRVMCIALVACTVETFKPMGRPWNPVHLKLIEEYSLSLLRYSLERLDNLESAVWMALVIAGSKDSQPQQQPSKAVPGAGAEPERDDRSMRTALLDRLVQHSRQARDWKYVRRVCWRFFWSDSLLERWHETWKDALARQSRRESPRS